MLTKFSRTLATLSAEPPRVAANLKIQGQQFAATSFGAPLSTSGEVVFTTSLVGYPESMTDPSYHGQILVFTQPLVGNYGVPSAEKDHFNLFKHFESGRIQVKGIIVNDYAEKYSHWNAVESLGHWCARQGIPALTGVDTRAVVSLLRHQGTTMGQMTIDGEKDVPVPDYTGMNMVARVSPKEKYVVNPSGSVKIALLDCGAKQNIIRCLAKHGAQVIVHPWNYDLSKEADQFDGVFLSNGPGDPANCGDAITNVRKLLNSQMNARVPIPIFGICMGHQLLGLAAGFKSYKLPFGNRGHNQPALNLIKGGCVMTSQNHGYALFDDECPSGWVPMFRNANDGSNEGICHSSLPFSSVQFHPEAMGGPQDTEFLFEDFIKQCQAFKLKRNVVSTRVEQPLEL